MGMSYTHRMAALPPQYDAAATEKKWQDFWLNNNTYAWDANAPREDSYVIDTPPPTVSGTLHMGHVFSYTQADFVARYQRMTGKNVFYPMGFDDNGLPTERLVEKTKKLRAADMSREEFIKVCLGVSEEARAEFRALFRSIALSVDWSTEYHTISDGSRRLSQLSFLDLINKGHAYRKLQPMLWDPVDQTAIAQAEVVDKELPSHFTDIAFTAEDGTDLIIGTTRPELLPACVALFYHPDDVRYQHLKGRSATVPLFGFSVPILSDDTVEPEKGTGLMMCCTFGDEADIQKWMKKELPTRLIINKYGKIDLNIPLKGLDDMLFKHDFPTGFEWPTELFNAIQGKKVSNNDPKHPGAREIILGLLKDAGFIRKQTAITHAVKTAERSGATLELIPTAQWFVKVTDKKDALKEKAALCNWNPEWMRIRIEQWIDGLNWDWCISRQRYFGVPFPVWTMWTSKVKPDNAGFILGLPNTIYATPEELPVNPLNNAPKGFKILRDYDNSSAKWLCEALEDYIDSKSGNVLFHKGETVACRPDADVMDTWATSSISPQLSAQGISPELCADPARFGKLFPADLRPQAHEIIRTWAFYTIVKAHLHNETIPWKNLMISGWCLAEDKSKMSKSKGNVVTPVALIEEKGTDAVRYWAGTSRLGQDTAFSPDLLKIGRKLVGKLWNATQFAAIHLEKMDAASTTAASDSAITEQLDQWILSRLGETVGTATKAFARYEYADALDATNSFFWADFCDNYLELIKKRVYNEDGSFTAAQQQSAVRALYYCLDGILKLYAPFVPHVTEELYSHIFADAYAAKGSLHAQCQWPDAAAYPHSAEALAAGTDAVAVLELIRKAKSEMNRSIKFPIAKLTLAGAASIPAWLADVNGAGNVLTAELAAKAEGMVSTPDGKLSVGLEFAAEADAA